MGELCEGNAGPTGIVPSRRGIEDASWDVETESFNQALMPNQMANATMQATTANHTSGVTRVELPLRGESLAA